MAAAGEVVFCRGQEDDSDLWDDTALIQAYDEAVKQVKKQFQGEVKVEPEDDQERPESGKKQHKRKQRKHRRKEKQAASQNNRIEEKEWKVGDRCQAWFTEDEQLYHAVITSIDSDTGTCKVRYTEYGNEETQALADLLPTSAKPQPADPHPDYLRPEMDGGMDWSSPHRSPASSSRGQPPYRHRSRQAPSLPTQSQAGWGWPPTPPPFGVPQFPPPTPLIPPMFPQMMRSPFPGWPTDPTQSLPQVIPDIAPPPPLVDENEAVTDDKEALHSMLISWYMSGYHTGYYQGLKEGKKNQGRKTDTTSAPEQQAESTR